MTDNFEQEYNQWSDQYDLTNPKKSLPPRDRLFYALQYTVAIGAMLLSGSRTGNAVAEVGTLADFGSKLGAGENNPIFVGAAAVLGFLTFDAAIFLFGWLSGEENSSRRWHWALLGAAIIPALLANLYPAAELKGEQFAKDSGIIVNVAVGLGAPIMALIAGRVIGSVTRKRREEQIALNANWERAKKAAWTRHQKKQSPQPVKATKPQISLTDKVWDEVEAGKSSVAEIGDTLGLSETECLTELMRLEDQGKLKLDGMTVLVEDF